MQKGILQSCMTGVAIDGVPWSVRISFGIPTQLIRRNISLEMFFDVAFLRGMASGYLIVQQRMTNIYS